MKNTQTKDNVKSFHYWEEKIVNIMINNMSSNKKIHKIKMSDIQIYLGNANIDSFETSIFLTQIAYSLTRKKIDNISLFKKISIEYEGSDLGNGSVIYEFNPLGLKNLKGNQII
jgi:hypothetical protein